MTVTMHRSLNEMRSLCRREKLAQRAQRMRVVVLAMEGFSAEQIAERVGLCRRAVQRWVARFNANDLDGLDDAPGRGKSPLLSSEQEDWLRRRLDAGPTPEDGVCTLRGKDVQRIIEQEFGKIRSLDAMYHLLHKLGYESLKPRPRHPSSNSEAQEAFKKVSRRGSTTSNGSIRIVRYMSSSRTSVALASKEH